MPGRCGFADAAVLSFRLPNHARASSPAPHIRDVGGVPPQSIGTWRGSRSRPLSPSRPLTHAHPLTLSPSCPFAASVSEVVTLSPCRPLTFSPSHPPLAHSPIERTRRTGRLAGSLAGSLSWVARSPGRVVAGPPGRCASTVDLSTPRRPQLILAPCAITTRSPSLPERQAPRSHAAGPCPSQIII